MPAAQQGRGKHYQGLRLLRENLLRLVYHKDWPARLLASIPAANRVRLEQHRLALLPGAAERRSLRVAFASDLHLGPTTPRPLLENAFAKLAAARPDVLMLGGDYVFLDFTLARARLLARLVQSVQAPVTLAVLGNHDLWTDHRRVTEVLVEAGSRVLVNDAVRLPAPWDDVAVAGLDEPWSGDADAERTLRACGDAALVLALCHSPEAITVLGPGRVGALLCGHTHGGQLALPGPRPLVLPPGAACHRYPFGLHDAGGTCLYVSRGIGNPELPLRTFAPPDVAVLDVVPVAAGAAQEPARKRGHATCRRAGAT
jgi:hypothetical protein